MVDVVWKGVKFWIIGYAGQFLRNKFVDLSTPSMRRVDDGEKSKRKKEIKW